MQVGVYYFPNYHLDPRNEARHGKGWSEWELMKCARARFEGHEQPQIPLWGYEDEADPKVMAHKIDVAAGHGIDAFVFDWYWYDGPYLERALNEGYLQAENRGKVKFALMWANHDWMDRHPVDRRWDKAELLYPWSTTKAQIGAVWDDIIKRYLTRPEYWYVDGLPYFSIYAVNRFIAQMGGVEPAAEALELLRTKAKAAGLPGVHINAIWYDNLELIAKDLVCTQRDWAEKVGFSSYTSYNFAYSTDGWEKCFPLMDYSKAAAEYVEQVKRDAYGKLAAPYYPVVTVGWDCSPRTVQSEMYEFLNYPFMAVMNNDPDAMEKTLCDFGEMLKNAPEAQQIVFINAWNEWTEGSHLEPDTRYGMRPLEAVKNFRKKFK